MYKMPAHAILPIEQDTNHTKSILLEGKVANVSNLAGLVVSKLLYSVKVFQKHEPYTIHK